MLLRPTRRSALPTPRAKQRGFIINPFAFGGGAGPLTVDAVDFDGANDWLSRAALTGQADSKTGIWSYWVHNQTAGFRDLWCVGATQGGGLNRPRCECSDGFFSMYNGDTTAIDANWTAPSNNAWHHILVAWDMANGTTPIRVAIDGSLVSVTVNFQNNVNVPWGAANEWVVGDYLPSDGNGAKFDGGLAEFYVAIGQWLDLSNAANILKFRTAGGKPANLGATGSLPTGSTPSIYLHIDDGEAAANFATNRAGNGNFTVSGALSTFGSSPSD